jgi:hypothetical protein
MIIDNHSANVLTLFSQRAFRQRKDAYIKKLEAQVAQYPQMEAQIKQLHEEGCVLRDYVQTLQDRLAEHGIAIPAMPETVTLTHPVVATGGPEMQDAQMQDAQMDEASMDDPAGEPHMTDAVAQAVAGLGAQEQLHQQHQEHQHQHQHQHQQLEHEHTQHQQRLAEEHLAQERLIDEAGSLEGDEDLGHVQEHHQDQVLGEVVLHQAGSDEVGVNDGASYPQQFESEGP